MRRRLTPWLRLCRRFRKHSVACLMSPKLQITESLLELQLELTCQSWSANEIKLALLRYVPT